MKFRDDCDSHIGEVRTMQNGQKATIIACCKVKEFASDEEIYVDVLFEDGTLRKDQLYESFLIGYILSKIENHIGETRIMQNGQKATIISQKAEVRAYREELYVDVLFEDGTPKKDQRYESFLDGFITNSNKACANSYVAEIRNKCEKNRVGETRIMKNGQKATIIIYRNNNDIDLQFEDGTIIEHKKYCNFSKGEIDNPNLTLKNNRTSNYKDFTARFTFRKDEKAYFNIHCNICGLDEIWTPQQMDEHRKDCFWKGDKK